MKTISRFAVLLVVALAMVGCISINITDDGVVRTELGLGFEGTTEQLEEASIELNNVSSYTHDTLTETGVISTPFSFVESDEIVGLPNLFQLEAMEQLADINARIAELEALIAKAEAQLVVAKKAEKARVATPTMPKSRATVQAVTLVKQIVLDRHTSSLYRYWQRQDTIYKRTNPWDDNYCRSVEVRGGSGNACDATTWKHLSRGTVITVPAGMVFAKVPLDVKAPVAIALAPTEDSNLFKLDTEISVVTENERMANAMVVALNQEVARLDARLVGMQNGLLVAIILLCIFIVLYFATFFGYGAQKRLIHERNVEIAKLKNAVDEILGIATRSFDAECHPEKAAREHEAPATRVPPEGNSVK